MDSAERDELVGRIEEVRTSHGLSQRAFCREIEYRIGSYSNVVGGRKTKPSIDLLQKVSGRFRISWPWLINGSGDLDAPAGKVLVDAKEYEEMRGKAMAWDQEEWAFLKKNETLTAENTLLREALGFYRKKSNYEWLSPSEMDDQGCDGDNSPHVLADGGRIAQTALAGEPEAGEGE